MTDLNAQFLKEVSSRLERLAGPNAAIDEAISVIANSLENNGVVQAFGTGQSEAFAMEVAGRAGGLIATNRIALRTLVLRGDRDAQRWVAPSLSATPMWGKPAGAVRRAAQ